MNSTVPTAVKTDIHLLHCGCIGRGSMNTTVSPLAGEYVTQVFVALRLMNAGASSLTTPTNRPRSDTCKTCDSMKVKTDAEADPSAKAQLFAEWELHKRKAERCTKS